jgi:hypothetical protein
MPLMKYFIFVGAALVLLLFTMNWLVPDPTVEPVYSSTQRPVIRISSIQTLPERVVFDTNMPAPAPSVMRVAAQPLRSAFALEQITPGLLPTFSILAQVTQVSPKKTIIEKREPAKITAKREPSKTAVANRIAPQPHIAAVREKPVREAELDAKPSVKTTFLDDIAGRFGQIFKVN